MFSQILALNHSFLRVSSFIFLLWPKSVHGFLFTQYLQANKTTECDCVHENKRGWQRKLRRDGWSETMFTLWSQRQARGSDPSSSKPESHYQSRKPNIAGRCPKLWMLKIWKTEEPVFPAQSGTTQRDINQKRWIFSPFTALDVYRLLIL